jgi:hypothetical protein
MKIIFTLCLLLFSIFCYSQSRITVGDTYAYFGLSNSSSAFTGMGLGKLNEEFVIGIPGSNGQFAARSIVGDVIIRNAVPNSRLLFNFGHDFTAMILKGNKLGIGTIDNPIARLDLGNDYVMSNPASLESPTISLWKSGDISLYGFGVSGGTMNYFADKVHTFYTHSGGGRTAACFVNPQGMGIGLIPSQTLPGNGEYKLVVNGKVKAKEIKVTVTDYGDYIFSPAYRLRPLSEVDAYIKQNGHLPEVPSAAEVAREGMNVGEMENTLLKKIEELTLYLIQQQQRIEQLEAGGAKRSRKHLMNNKL